MSLEQPPTLTPPTEVIEKINDAKDVLINNLKKFDGDKIIDRADLYNIDTFLNGVIDACEAEKQGDEFGKHLSGLVEAYKDLKVQLHKEDSNKKVNILSMTVNNLIKQIEILEKTGAEARLREFVANMN